MKKNAPILIDAVWWASILMCFFSPDAIYSTVAQIFLWFFICVLFLYTVCIRFISGYLDESEEALEHYLDIGRNEAHKTSLTSTYSEITTACECILLIILGYNAAFLYGFLYWVLKFQRKQAERYYLSR